MKTRKFSMSQTDLYSIGEHVLDKTAANLSAFTAKIPKYDADYLAAIRAKLNDAQNKPAHTERVEAPKAARQELLELHTDCLAKWQELKRAIIAAHADTHKDIKLKAAGHTHYADATKKNWAKTQKLMDAATRFLTKNAEHLVTKKEVTTTFQEEFKDLQTRYRQSYQAMIGSRSENDQESNFKTDADNVLFKALMSILTDAKTVFKGDADLRKQFTMSYISDLVGKKEALSPEKKAAKQLAKQKKQLPSPKE